MSGGRTSGAPGPIPVPGAGERAEAGVSGNAGPHVLVPVAAVAEVLLADGWHPVRPGSFRVGEYGFLSGEVIVVGTADVRDAPSHWASWEEPDGRLVACPLTAVQALRWAVASP